MNACTRCGLAHPAYRPCPVHSILPASEPTAPLQPGAGVGGRFRVEVAAHRSGMSTVYQAADLRNHGAMVALKEFNAAMLPAADRAEALAWLAREAGLLSTLSDARLPRLLAACSEGDRHYVAMPFLAGETLEERIVREGPQPETLVLGWGRELAGLLAYLHGQGVVHRDLKPANVLLRPDGSLVLLDLGVARPMPRGGAGTAVGTPGYAAPEQYQGLADERSDLYGLGATLHRALTGYDPDAEAPFRQPGVRELRPEISRQTAALVMGLLALAPERRPAGAEATLAALGVAMRGAFSRTYGPLRAMYWGMLAGLFGAAAAGGLLYHWAYGTPVVGGDAAAFKTFDPIGDPLRVLLIFLPGLLPFVPLLSPHLRALARLHAVPRLYRNRAAKLLAVTWSVPLLVWLSNLYDQRWGNVTAVPGHAFAAAGIALGGLVPAAAGLLALRRDVLRMQVRVERLRLRFLLFCAVLALWPISLAMQASTFRGTCYLAALQQASQSQFLSVRGLAGDRHGNLFVLDQYGLRERTPDGRFLVLLDFTASGSPLYSPGDFGLLTLDATGRPILGTTGNRQQLFALTAPGLVRPLGLVPGSMDSLAVGVGGAVYALDVARNAVIAMTPEGRAISLRPGPLSPHWRPRGLVVDGHGALYIFDLATSALLVREPGGRWHRLATIEKSAATGAVETATPLVPLAVDRRGTVFVALGTDVLAVYPNGKTMRLPAGDGFHTISALAVGDGGIYAAANDSAQTLSVSNETHPNGTVGGTDAPSLHCRLP